MPERTLLEQLKSLFADHQLFLVGGAVRDELRGQPRTDLDLATDARPDEVERRVASWADTLWLVGHQFGTIGLQKDGLRIEITTFRSDRYDGVSRRPEVIFGDNISDDLARRDFTINAIARDLHTGDLLDPFGGREDLARRLVRFVGEPAARIAEDPLRVLRAVRFSAELGFHLDPATATAIAHTAGTLRRISWERIREELDKVLVSPHPKEGLRLFVDLGLAEVPLPELIQLHLPEPDRHRMKDLLEHTLDTVRFVPPAKLLRWAALLHDIAKPETFTRNQSGVHFYGHDEIGAARARVLLTRLRQPSDFIDEVAFLVRKHLRVPYYSAEWSLAAVRRLMYELGAHLDDAILLAKADVRASEPSDPVEFEARMEELCRRVAEVGEAAEVARMRPLLDGNEIMALLHLAPGPRVGEVIRYLLDQQLEGKLTTKEEAREAVVREFGEENAT